MGSPGAHFGSKLGSTKGLTIREPRRIQSACIQCEGVKSRSFNTFNGVKQGGVISLILFSIYYDE